MILKVPPSDLYKNANLAELRCDKKKICTGIQFTLRILKCTGIFISSNTHYTCKVMQKTYSHVILAVCRFICSTYLMKLFSLGEKSNKVLIYFIFEWYLFQIRIFTVGGL